ncbi:MarR family winged helix-turn-helix transcriptional regulator [Vibrio palustris]|nr:MarR family transcriptional regulator [Vibrio palustris]
MQQHTACWQQEMQSLTKPQFAVMRAIADQPGIEQIQLMDASVSTKATLAEMLGRLEKRGLIYRQASELDKRRRYVFLTESGQQMLDEANPKADIVDKQFLDRLNADEQSTFVRLMQQMIEP